MMKPEIVTVSGNRINFLTPDPEMVSIIDIAYGLSNICRFAGHTRQYYSVAQHSVNVSLLIRPDLALEGLLHDAAEAYIGDVSSPLKQLLPEYREIEARVECAIREKFGIKGPPAPEVKTADLLALRSEHSRFMPQDPESLALLGGIPLVDLRDPPCGPADAMNLFMERYYQIK